MNVIAIHLIGSRRSKATCWQHWGGSIRVDFDSGETKYYPESKSFNDVLADLKLRGFDVASFETPGASYPPRPEHCELYLHNLGYEKPVTLGGWDWSTTFGRWGRIVKFADGWEGFTYPKDF